MPYGLKTHIIDELQKVFRKYPQVERVLLYGSRAKGNYKEGSDIDLTIIAKEIDLKILHKIENEIDDLLLPYKIDLSIFSEIDNKSLLEHIDRVGVLFYGRE